MIRSTLSAIHRCARRSSWPRPSKPIASQSGCAARARCAMSRSSAGPSSGTVVIISPVAGFSTPIVAAVAVPVWSVEGDSVTLAMFSSCVLISSSLVDLDRLDPWWLKRAVPSIGGERLDRIDRLHSSRHLTEHGVLAVKPRRGAGRDDEELRSIRVGPSIRHGQRAAHHLVWVDLVLEGVAGTARAGAVGVPALNHEVTDDAVEDDAVIEVIRGQLPEVLDRLGGILVEQLELDGARGGVHLGC